jgi:hypothetical protein
VIPHAPCLAASLAAGSLAVAVVETALRTLSMASTGTAQAVAAGRRRAGGSAVDVTAIAGPADREQRLAAGAAGEPADCVHRQRRPPDGRRGDPSESAENVQQSESGEAFAVND